LPAGREASAGAGVLAPRDAGVPAAGQKERKECGTLVGPSLTQFPAGEIPIFAIALGFPCLLAKESRVRFKELWYKVDVSTRVWQRMFSDECVLGESPKGLQA